MLNIVNNVAINMAVQGSLWFDNLDSYGFASSNGIPETIGSSVFWVWKKSHTYSTEAATVYKYFSSPTSSSAFTVSFFLLMIATLTDVRGNLRKYFVCIFWRVETSDTFPCICSSSCWSCLFSSSTSLLIGWFLIFRYLFCLCYF